MEQTTSWSIASIWLLMNMQLEPLQSRWLNMLNIDVWVSVRTPFCQWGVPSHLLSPGYQELAPPWDCGSPTLRQSDVIFFWGDESMGIIIAQIDMNSRNETCLNVCETTIAPTPNYHTNQLKYAKILPYMLKFWRHTLAFKMVVP